jgi:hypothetical protein
MGKPKTDKQKQKGKQGVKLVKNNNKIRTVSESTKTLRQLYNKLMSKDKQQQNKGEIVKRVLKQINGNYNEICFKHDGCRILQGSIKYGTLEQKKEIINNLIPLLYDLINGKYSIYLSAKIFKYADNKQKSEIISKVVIPNYKKILKFSGGISFTRFIFKYGTSTYIEQLVDKYFTNYLQIPFDDIKNIVNKVEQTGDVEMKSDNIIVQQGNNIENDDLKEKIKTHLEKQLEIGVNKNFIFHGFLNKIFDYLDEKTQVYITELFDDDFLPFLDSAPGFELVCKLYAVSPAKTRKKIIKQFRESLNDNLTNETYIIFLTKIMLFTDDTKIIEKHFTKLIIETLSENFQQNPLLIKLIWNLLEPFNKKCNNPPTANVLSYSKPYSNKKDLNKRQKEVLSSMFDDVYKIIYYETRFLLTDIVYSMLLTDFIKYLITANDLKKTEEMLNHVISLIEIDVKSNVDTIDNCILCHTIGHKTIKRIMKELNEIQSDVAQKYEMSFCSKIAKMLQSNLDGFLKTKAIFIIVQLVEKSHTKDLIINDLNKFKGEILKNKDNKKLTGMMLLAKALN